MSHERLLVGHWRKSGNEACAAGYAATLQIKAGGLYFGQTDPPGEFTWWDGGTWRIQDGGKLALSVANDAVITYAYELDGDVLSFTDDKGCRFGYRRAV